MCVIQDDDADTDGWTTFDPEIESQVAENYGVGDGWVEDDAFHTYFKQSDRNGDDDAESSAQVDDDKVSQTDDTYVENEYVPGTAVILLVLL